MRRLAAASLLFILALVSAACAAPAGRKAVTVRVGHFPNLTHGQALVGRANGAFDEALGPDARIDWKVFNAGPSVIEAIFAGQLDLAYIGPSPAVNGYTRSDGRALRVVAGAASGGAAFVVRPESGIREPQDLRGKRVATPQLGNTQDVALRSWLAARGLESTETGGDVKVLPIANADQMSLFLKGELDGAWSVEPWVSVFEQQAGARIWFEESTLWPDGRYATTLVVARKEFADKHPDLVKRFLAAHAKLTEWIRTNPAEAKRLISQEVEREIRKPIPAPVLEAAFGRIEFTTDPLRDSVLAQAEAAYRIGYLKKKPDLSELFDGSYLSQTGPARSETADRPA